MPLTPEEQRERSIKMFGTADIEQWFKDSLAHMMPLPDNQSVKMMVISILSDVQEEIAMGLHERARQNINIVKWIIMSRLT